MLEDVRLLLLEVFGLTGNLIFIDLVGKTFSAVFLKKIVIKKLIISEYSDFFQLPQCSCLKLQKENWYIFLQALGTFLHAPKKMDTKSCFSAPAKMFMYIISWFKINNAGP